MSLLHFDLSGRKVMTKSRNDFIVDNMISSMELNSVTDFGSLQRLGEELHHSNVPVCE